MPPLVVVVASSNARRLLACLRHETVARATGERVASKKRARKRCRRDFPCESIRQNQSFSILQIIIKLYLCHRQAEKIQDNRPNVVIKVKFKDSVYHARCFCLVLYDSCVTLNSDGSRLIVEN